MFNIPSNRLLWQTLGELDSLVEYQEVANRLMLASYNPSIESFHDFLIRTSKATGINLNDISFQNYRESLYQGFLIYPNASFDEFLTGFADDVRCLVDTQFVESKVNGCHFEKMMDALSQIGIKPNIEEPKLKLYHYYRLLRNDLAHCLKKDYKKEYQEIDLECIHSCYPRLSKPNAKSNLTFDDFILCTANIKDIADTMTQSLKPHINWVKKGVENKDRWFPKHIRLIEENRLDRLSGYIRTTINYLYGENITDYDVEEIKKLARS